MSDLHYVGGSVRLTATFDVDGVATDPDGVVLTITDPASVETVVGTDDLDHPATGEYALTFTTPTAGAWTYSFEGTGVAAGFQPGSFDVLPLPSRYAPVLLAAEDYGDCRMALGFDATDTANVPAALIEGRTYLRAAETEVRRLFTDATTVVDPNDADYDEQRSDTLKEAVILATASRLAALWFAERSGSEITSQALDTAKLTYRAGPEWTELGKRLATEAAKRLAAAINWGVTIPAVGLATLAGPTRATATTAIGVADIERALWPPVVKGYDG